MHFWMLPLCWVLKEILQEILNSHWKIKGQQQRIRKGFTWKGSQWRTKTPEFGIMVFWWTKQWTLVGLIPQYFPHNWSLISLKGITPSYWICEHYQLLGDDHWRSFNPFKIQSCQDVPPQAAILSCPQLCSDREGKLTHHVICVPSFTWRCCMGHGLQSCYCAA